MTIMVGEAVILYVVFGVLPIVILSAKIADLIEERNALKILVNRWENKALNEVRQADQTGLARPNL